MKAGNPESRIPNPEVVHPALHWVVCGLVAFVSGCGNPTGVEWLIVGDSITGTLDSPTYPARLQSALGLEDGVLVADGSGGRSALEGARRVSAGAGRYPNIQHFIYFLGGADVVGFAAERDLAGIDDPEFTMLLERLGGAIDRALALAASYDWTVWVVTYPPLPVPDLPCASLDLDALDSDEAAQARNYVRQLNELLRARADSVGAHVIDLEERDPLGLEPAYFFDCLHPNGKGAELLAQDLATVITTTLREQ